MSNRPRRRWLREQRLRAVVRASIETPPDEFIQTMADWNRWLRSAFRSIERLALQPDHNLPGEAGRLQDIQISNKPGGFDLLNDHPEEWPEDWKKEIDDLDRLRWRYEEAVDLFYRARDGLEPMRRVARRKFAWEMWVCDRSEPGRPLDDFVDVRDPASRYLDEVTDFTAAIYRATRILRYNSLAIHQHAPTYGHATTAARNVLLWGTVTDERAIPSPWRPTPSGRCLNDEAALPEAGLLRVLALCAAHRARGVFWDLAEEIAAEGGAIDPDSYEYGRRNLEDAKTWCAEAERIDDMQREANEKQRRQRSEARKGKPVGSIAIRQFAAELRMELPSMGNEELFHEAVGRVKKGTEKGAQFEVTGSGNTYLLRTEGDGFKAKLFSKNKMTGKADGRSVSLPTWRDLPEVKKNSE